MSILKLSKHIIPIANILFVETEEEDSGQVNEEQQSLVDIRTIVHLKDGTSFEVEEDLDDIFELLPQILV